MRRRKWQLAINYGEGRRILSSGRGGPALQRCEDAFCTLRMIYVAAGATGTFTGLNVPQQVWSVVVSVNNLEFYVGLVWGDGE